MRKRWLEPRRRVLPSALSAMRPEGLLGKDDPASRKGVDNDDEGMRQLS